MTITEAQLQARLQKLRDAYASKLAARITEIVAEAQPLMEGTWSAQAAERTGRLAHQLAGTGETFGFPLIGQRAQAIELLLLETDARPEGAQHPPAQRVIEAIQALLDAARVAELDTPSTALPSQA